jgi:uncharacterized protein (TIGR02996 family)
MTEREKAEYDAFRQALDDNNCDLTTRLVFADWLDDHDLPEESAFHRAWNLDKQLAAEAFRSKLLERLGDQRWGAGIDVGWNEVARRLHAILDGGGASAIVLPMNNVAIGTDEKALWTHFEILTGRLVPAALKEAASSHENDEGDGLFVCGCGMGDDFTESQAQIKDDLRRIFAPEQKKEESP